MPRLIDQHRIMVVTRKDGDRTMSTPSCRCGWRAEPQPLTSALSAWDDHITQERKR